MDEFQRKTTGLWLGWASKAALQAFLGDFICLLPLFPVLFD
jgi:hypothetical protein